MSLGHDSSGLMQGSYAYISAHIDAVSGIRPPGERWQASDATSEARRHLQKLLSDGVIRRVGKTEEGNNIYETRAEAWEIVEECQEHRERLLCNHGGIRNLGGGMYECAEPTCDHRYTRDTVNLLLSEDT